MSENDTKNDGGPAFPCPALDDAPGMSLRDWFAGQALAGMLASERHNQISAELANEYKSTAYELTSVAAYGYADRMLFARDVRAYRDRSLQREEAEQKLDLALRRAPQP